MHSRISCLRANWNRTESWLMILLARDDIALIKHVAESPQRLIAERGWTRGMKKVPLCTPLSSLSPTDDNVIIIYRQFTLQSGFAPCNLHKVCTPWIIYRCNFDHLSAGRRLVRENAENEMSKFVSKRRISGGTFSLFFSPIARESPKLKLELARRNSWSWKWDYLSARHSVCEREQYQDRFVHKFLVRSILRPRAMQLQKSGEIWIHCARCELRLIWVIYRSARSPLLYAIWKIKEVI